MLFPYLIGELEDKTGMLIPYQYKNLLGLNHGLPQEFSLTSQPFSLDIMLLLSKFIDPIDVWNLFIIMNLLLNVFIGYKFYRIFLNKPISTILTILLSIHPYVLFKMDNHIALFATWNITLFLFLLLKLRTNWKSGILLGITLGSITLFNNYYGFFLVIIYGFYSLLDLKNRYKQTLTTYLISGFLVLLFAFPYIYNNLIFKSETKIISNQIEVKINGESKLITGSSWKVAEDELPKANLSSSYTLKRPIEDFFYFTSRPWYMFLWPVDNPIFGSLSEDIIKFLQEDWGHWLAQNYFMREHSAALLGTLNLIMAIIGLFYFIKDRKSHERQNRKQLNILLYISILIFTITLPPYITVNGIKIYMPSYILSQLFPMFRSLVRMNIIIFIIQLIFTGIGLRYIGKSINSKFLRYAMVSLFFLISSIELFVPIDIIKINQPPEIYSYIDKNTDQDSVIAVYPYESRNDASFWIREHKRALINPGWDQPEFGFKAREFTDNLETCNGLHEASNLGVEYIVVVNNNGKGSKIIGNANLKNCAINYITIFSEKNYHLLKIN